MRKDKGDYRGGGLTASIGFCYTQASGIDPA
jgi:hypothetical protein